MELGKYKTIKKSGKENFHIDGNSINENVLSFWQWSSSEILGNALRGVLAEYIVSLDIHPKPALREEWDAYDLITPDGTTVEVKSGSYLQSWEQKKLSTISFGVQSTYGWDSSTNTQSNELKRQADVYVFCILAHKDKSSVDPLNLSQWDFYVLPTHVLNNKIPNQKTITLSSLLRLGPQKCKFGEIWDTIKQSQRLTQS
jgi:hypothetical protein